MIAHSSALKEVREVREVREADHIKESRDTTRRETFVTNYVTHQADVETTSDRPHCPTAAGPRSPARHENWPKRKRERDWEKRKGGGDRMRCRV